MDKPLETFGCEACWPPDADAAWDRVSSLRIEHEYVDESHFMIKLRSCRKCGQRFVSVFTETVDWADGEDPQFWSVIPVTLEESQAMHSDGSNVIATIDGSASTRRSLCHDNPKLPPKKTYWSRGIVVGSHD